MSGQVTGIARMVEEERYCVDILTQVAALRVALDSLGSILLSAHIEDCVYGGNASTGCSSELKCEERVEEVRTALSRFLK